jgi:tryptophan 2,3-dioxygenase
VSNKPPPSPPADVNAPAEAAKGGGRYWDYLRIPELLGAQRPVTEHHDEMQFIIVHQVYELWFKLTLHEMVHVQKILAERDVSELALIRAHHYMTRANRVWGIMVQQIHVLETMRPIDFLGFRNALTPASGFQSLQLRLIETLCGLTNDQRVTYGGKDYREFAGFPAEMVAQIDRLSKTGSLRELLLPFLAEIPLRNADREWVVKRALEHGMQREARLSQMFTGDELERDAIVRERVDRETKLKLQVAEPGFQVMLAVYTWPEKFANVYELCEDLVQFEQSFILWRTHHARTVERFIGKKIGTGGSTGVPYLENTARYRIFDELWSVRTLLVHPDEDTDNLALPPEGRPTMIDGQPIE